MKQHATLSEGYYGQLGLEYHRDRNKVSKVNYNDHSLKEYEYTQNIYLKQNYGNFTFGIQDTLYRLHIMMEISKY